MYRIMIGNNVLFFKYLIRICYFNMWNINYLVFKRSFKVFLYNNYINDNKLRLFFI